MVSHVTLVWLHWVSVFWSVLEGHLSSYRALAHGHYGKYTHTHTGRRIKGMKSKKQQGNRSLDIFMIWILKKKTTKINLISVTRAKKTYEPTRHMRSTHVHKHTLIITAPYGTCTLCFGTTQDIPAGLYQPEFQDTASLSYGATVPAKNTDTHTRTHTHWQQKHLSKDKDDLFRQKEKQARKRAKQQRGKSPSSVKTQQQFFIYLFIFLLLKNSSYTKPKY